MTTWRLTEIRDGQPWGDPLHVPPTSADPEDDPAPGAAAPAVTRSLDDGPPAPTRRGRRFEVVVDGWRFEFEAEDADRAALRARATSEVGGGTMAAGVTEIRAIIPGRVAAVGVVEGDEVTAGQPLLVVEAMKMQNELRAPRAGVVRALAVHAGQTIEMGDLLVTLE